MWRKNKRKPLAQPEEEQQAASRASNPRNSNNDALAREEAMSRREELLHKMEEDNNKKLGEIARRELDASKAEEDAHKKKEQAIEREEEAIRREEYIAEREQSLAMKEEELARREEEIAAMELEVKRRAKQLSGEENIFTSQAPVIDETPSEHGTDYETTEPSIKAEYNPLDSLRISTGDLKFVPWKEASSLKPPDALHAAIEIPIGQPSRDDLVGTSDRLPQRDEPQRKEQPSDTSKHAPKKLFQRRGWQTDHLHVNPPEELPDRIRICSLRLGVYMDYNIHDTSLNRSTYRRTPYTIPRPFKILVEKNVEIREGLVELEKIRSRRSPGMTEADHDRAWKADMPQDLPEMDRFDGAKCNFAELTAMIKDLRCLVQFMDGYIAPTIQHIGASSQVYFSDLWFVFPARSLLYIRDKEVPQKIWKVIQRTGGTRDTVVSSRPSKRADRTHGFVPFYIDCFHLDHDGTRYIQMYRQIKIEYFEDYQPLASLPVIPFDVAQKLGYTDKQALARRGKEFVQCTTQPRHKQYTGRNQILRPNGGKLNEKDADVPESATRYAEWIESEVMVDFQRALQEIPNWRPKAKELDLFKALSPPRDYTGLDNDTIWDTKVSDQVADEAWEKCQTWDKTRTHPSEEQDLLLLPERVFGFVFRTRKWACLRIGIEEDGGETLRDKQRRPEPWHDLQLPDGHKRLVQSLIESHSSQKGRRALHFDVVKAKGRGVTILLHGVPGVGKTSTAECAAEANSRPLLPITCGDLGTSPRDVEKKLEEAFQLAQLWECVLLLDEADIFLAQRTESDIVRNALVSVFLRVLEYYEGILFLTTNRVGVFDEAFKSRIHLPLYYPPLEWKNTEKIWRIHLKKLVESDLVTVNESDILEYAEHFFDRQNAKGSKFGPVWNGRQIRNAFQSAVALAGYGATGEKIRVTREHFESVAKVSDHFNSYIFGIKLQTDSEKAARWGYRFDGYQANELTTTHTHVQAGPGQMSNAGMPAGASGSIYGGQMGSVGQMFNPATGQSMFASNLVPSQGMALQQASGQTMQHPQAAFQMKEGQFFQNNGVGS